jgi:hypothetical protein
MTRQIKGYATNAVPKIDPNITTPSDEDFEQWCEHPVTKFVALAVQKIVQRQKDEWQKISWEGQLNLAPEMLNNVRIDLRARVEAHAAFLESKKEDYESIITE